MKIPKVKVGDMIRSAKPKYAGVEDSYVHVLIDNESLAEYATELVATGRWVLCEPSKKDEPCEN